MKNGNLQETLVEQNNLISRPLTEEEELYKENILDHYKHPRNAEILPTYTHHHRELNPLCGDEVEIFMNLVGGTIESASFQGKGCAISQAAASMLMEQIKGKKMQDIQKLAPWDIYNLLGIPISHTRSKCALLPLKTIQEGLKSWH
ncbi:iron-sulfur cluster assembly scaffold protein [Candidatus Woesearchaeota archaeon]|nr:iron-sulfur cluster assembly scaffold protein [Candidatus Woesearchaeota archaeon]